MTSERPVCPRCEGKGTVIHIVFAGVGAPISKTCPDCHGTGQDHA